MLLERAPSSEEIKLLNLFLNLCVDHGPNSPSAQATIKAAKDKKPIGEAVGLGITQIDDKHGGAIEPAMEFLYAIVKEKKSLTEIVQKYLNTGKIIGGFGHRVYKTSDPRADLILKKLTEYGVGGDYMTVMVEVQNEIEKQKGVRLPINIDGAIAVALCGFDWDPKLGKAVFIIARTPGLCAHYLNNS